MEGQEGKLQGSMKRKMSFGLYFLLPKASPIIDPFL